ncbi:MAG: MMPL family transporter [Solirubrobacteraceae bacterium]
MRPTRSSITARAGRWSAHHRKAAILGWIAFVAGAILLGSIVNTHTLTAEQGAVGDSGRAARVAGAAFPREAKEVVLIQSRTMTADQPALRAAISDVVKRLQNTRVAQDVRPSTVSPDRHSALVAFELPGDETRTHMSVAGPLAAVDAAARSHPEFVIAEYGDASAARGIMEAFANDLHKAESTSLPITLLILVLAFGALVAAGVPLLLAVTGVAATLGLIGPISHIAPVDQTISNVILLIGLAVGIDYSLFYLKRVREERAAGRVNGAAIEAAAATSGRAVLVSGVTVMIAMGGMYLGGSPTFSSLATGTILVVAVSVLGSLTVLPAVLSALGDRVEKGRLPLRARPKRRLPANGIWSRIVERVLRRPVLSALLSAGVLIALAIPALGMHISLPGTESLSRHIPVMRSFDRIQAAFPSQSTPVTIVVKARDVTTPAIERSIHRLDAAVAGHRDLFKGRATVEVSADRTVARISIPAAGTGADATSHRMLDTLRGQLIPAAFTSAPDASVMVGGVTAENADFNASLAVHTPLVFAFVLTAAFLLLLVTFRSLVIALKAIVLNLLSVGASYGVLVLVFQNAWGEKLLGFHSNGAIAAWLPLFLFVVLFGLSMDYHVFILSRVREAYDAGMSTERAVAHAIGTTAGVVTSAAAVMVAVFALFGTLSNIGLKEMGIGLAVAVFLDATIVRGMLLPASMKLLGEWNWWLPRKLHWLPRLSVEGEAVAPAKA